MTPRDEVYLTEAQSHEETCPLSAQQKKFCTICGSEKILEDFFRQASGPLGRKGQCKECCERDRQKRIERNKAARASAAPVMEKVCTNETCSHLGASQSTKNFFKNSASRDGFMYQCKDCVLKTNAKWNANNQDKRREASNRRKMKG